MMILKNMVSSFHQTFEQLHPSSRHKFHYQLLKVVNSSNGCKSTKLRVNVQMQANSSTSESEVSLLLIHKWNPPNKMVQKLVHHCWMCTTRRRNCTKRGVLTAKLAIWMGTWNGKWPCSQLSSMIGLNWMDGIITPPTDWLRRWSSSHQTRHLSLSHEV